VSIAKRVSDSLDRMEAGDPEGALFAICAALEATAAKEFAQGGRTSYKEFIKQNMLLITGIAFGGPTIENLFLAFEHPELKRSADGMYSIQEIFYHVVRCGLYHEAGLPTNLQFAQDNQIRCHANLLVLPASLIYGLILAVVVSPSNADAADPRAKPQVLNLGPTPIPISKLWGHPGELLWLLEVNREFGRLVAQAARVAGDQYVPKPLSA
jgi:hypothetical protein